MNKQMMTLIGVKRFKGDVEGQYFDICKLRFLVPVQNDAPNEIGFGIAEFAYGDSSKYEQFVGVKLPAEAEVSLEMVVRNNRPVFEVQSIVVKGKSNSGV